jgi:hypothetical protein
VTNNTSTGIPSANSSGSLSSASATSLNIFPTEIQKGKGQKILAVIKEMLVVS